MLAKVSSETLKLIGAESVTDFESKLSAFVAEANTAKTFMAESQVTLESLQKSITALEGKILTEAKVKEICGTAATESISTWAGSEAGKKIIGAEASRITAEALANVGTTPAKPAPVGAPKAEEKKTFAEIVQANVAGGKAKTDAISAAIESHPAEYKEYLKTGGKL